jgi:serine/threonine protein kinase
LAQFTWLSKRSRSNAAWAIKIIKLGMDTRQVVARFEAERQALAMMDHPNIANVLDAGATESGRPYFVMELVRGVKISDYCDQHDLGFLGSGDALVAAPDTDIRMWRAPT